MSNLESAHHLGRGVPLRLVKVLSSKNWSSPVVVGPVVAVENVQRFPSGCGKARSGFPQPRQIPEDAPIPSGAIGRFQDPGPSSLRFFRQHSPTITADYAIR